MTKKLGIIAAMALGLSGCGEVFALGTRSNPLGWADAPNDPVVYNHVLHSCLVATRGPIETHYNDWDEAIQECGHQAGRVSQYCPKGKFCRPDISSHDDVRSVLVAKP